MRILGFNPKPLRALLVSLTGSSQLSAIVRRRGKALEHYDRFTSFMFWSFKNDHTSKPEAPSPKSSRVEPARCMTMLKFPIAKWVVSKIRVPFWYP